MCPAVPATVANRSLQRKANSLRKKLTAAGVGERPIVFVTHSMGGLMVKAMLVESANSPIASGKKLSALTKGMYEYIHVYIYIYIYMCMCVLL